MGRGLEGSDATSSHEEMRPSSATCITPRAALSSLSVWTIFSYLGMAVALEPGSESQRWCLAFTLSACSCCAEFQWAGTSSNTAWGRGQDRGQG
jgi:hypothetical protein